VHARARAQIQELCVNVHARARVVSVDKRACTSLGQSKSRCGWCVCGGCIGGCGAILPVKDSLMSPRSNFPGGNSIGGGSDPSAPRIKFITTLLQHVSRRRVALKGRLKQFEDVIDYIIKLGKREEGKGDPKGRRGTFNTSADC
jgi:hypothetical protein